MNRLERIKEKLGVLKPHFLDVIDDSDAHKHHIQNTSKGESHYKIIISAESLNGMSRVIQHKQINKLLDDEFEKGMHALSIKII